MGLIIAVTLFPIPFNSEIIKQNKETIGFYNNFIPFKSIWELITDNPMYIAIKNILGNIIMVDVIHLGLEVLLQSVVKKYILIVVNVIRLLVEHQLLLGIIFQQRRVIHLLDGIWMKV